MGKYDYSKDQTKWNFDDERCSELNYYLVLCNRYLTTWQLEKAYSALQAIDNISYGLFNDDEIGKVEKQFEKVEEIRRKFYNKEENLRIIKIKLQKEERNLLKLLTKFHTNYHLYFRKQEAGFEGL